MQRPWKQILVWTAGLWLGLATAGWAAGNDPSVSGVVRESMSIQEIMQTGGWLMYVLGALSILALGIVFYFIFVLRIEQFVPTAFFKDANQAISAGRWEDARLLCDKRNSPLANILAAGLDHLRNTSSRDPQMLKEIMESEGIRQASYLQNQIQYLLDIAVIAPMVGLLGTVIGMLKAFNAVALDLAKAKPMILAAGVSQALITTVAGLIVAIPAMAAYAYFRNRSAKLVASMEMAATDLMSAVVEKSK